MTASSADLYFRMRGRGLNFFLNMTGPSAQKFSMSMTAIHEEALRDDLKVICMRFCSYFVRCVYKPTVHMGKWLYWEMRKGSAYEETSHC